MADGLYLLAASPRKGRLIEWNLEARSGTGTFQLDVGGQGNRWGDPATQTFNNYNNRIWKPIGFDSSWHYADRFFMAVSNSSGLTDVVIEMLWRSY